jgi:hypothetical protein
MQFEEWSNTIITIFSDDDVREPILFIKTNKNNETTQLKEWKYIINTSNLHHIMQQITDVGNDIDVGVDFRNNTLTTGHLSKDSRCVYGSGSQQDKLACDDADMNNRSIVYESEFELHEDEIFAPPSILSFYADIPKEHKLKLTRQKPESNTTKRAVVIKGCQCATFMVTWFKCDEHPWDTSMKLVLMVTLAPKAQKNLPFLSSL